MTEVRTPGPLPSWLDAAPSSSLAPPIDTLASELPIDDLPWPDFERLCLRMARTESDVVGAELYGIAGQQQEGIDLFAHLSGQTRYRVYQCKRVEEFTPAIIIGAVDAFLAGTWATRAGELVLSTSDDLRTTQRVEAFEAQRLRLESRGVKLIPWGRSQLSEALRAQPVLVHDFFGQPWVERFCGAAAASATASRIASNDFVALRSRLRSLYQSVFAAHDPGLTIRQDDAAIPVEQRYVLHDVLSDTKDRASERLRGDEDPQERESRVVALRRQPTSMRVPLMQELAGAPNARRVFLGGPGIGKSALLRYLALDLLSDEPTLPQLRQLWGERLPIWLPFATWVAQIDRGDASASITGVVKDWLSKFEASELFPLVEQALRDKRLLLLIDGLDEWTSEPAARIALAQLRVFVEQQGATVLVTSRPHGFRLLASELPAWRAVELAPLSKGQQETLATRWFTERQLTADEQRDATKTAVIRIQARDAVGELQQLGDVAELASVPLLLYVLLSLKVQQVELPSNRFRAYGELTRQLMVLHPRRRQVAGQVATRDESELREEELGTAYAYLAYRLMCDVPTGVVSQQVARSHLEHVLFEDQYGLAFPAEESARLARKLIDVGESVSGLLVKKSHKELGFYHRTIQEHLAAVHIASCSEGEQLAIVTERCVEAGWREVILSLAAQLTSRDLVAKLVARVSKKLAEASPHQRMQLVELLAELGSGPAGFSVVQRRELLAMACTEVEEGWSQRRCRGVLRSLLGALGRQNVRATVMPALRRWFPQRAWFRDDAIRALTTWPADEAWDVLRTTLVNDEDARHQLAAAETIASRWAGDATVLAQLRAIAFRPYGPTTRAALLKAILDGWTDEAELARILDADGSHLSHEISLVRVLAAAKAGDRSDRVRDELLALSNFRGAHYSWRHLPRQALLKYWPRDLVVRDRCLAVVRNHGFIPQSLPEPDQAWEILLHGYPGDDQVASAVADELDRIAIKRTDWFGFADNFRDHPALVERVDRWIEEADRLKSPQTSGAALVTRSPRSKQILLSQLNDSHAFWPAQGLLRGWGMGDPEVAAALTQLAMGDNARASSIAHLLPQVIADSAQCFDRLVELLLDRDAERTDFAMQGFLALGRERDERVITAGVERLCSSDTNYDGFFAATLFRCAPQSPGVRELALRELESTAANLAAIVEGFGADADMRKHLRDFLTPLRTELRQTIADAVERSTSNSSDVLDALRAFAREHEADVAVVAAIALYRNLAAQGQLTDNDVEKLRTELRCYGLTYELRRQAAYAAALEIGRAELIDEAKETIGEPRPLRVSLTNVGTPNRPLIRQVLSHWSTLQARYPNAVLSRLQDRGSHANSDSELDQEAWAVIADDAAQYADVDAYLAQHLNKLDGARLDPALLRYLAGAEPRSVRLRDHCLRIVAESDERDAFSDTDPGEAAADILVQQFAEDNSVWDRVSELLRDERHPVFRYGAFMALARARPGHPALGPIAESILSNSRGRHAGVFFHAWCEVGTVDELLDNAVHYWGEPNSIGRWLLPPLVERLGRDEVAHQRFYDSAVTQQVPLRIAFAVALSRVAPLTTEFAAGLRALQSAQLAEDSAAGFAFDPSTGEVRAIAAVLEEILA